MAGLGDNGYGPTSVVILFWTVANLLPRAISHHKWYKENVPGYPKAKKGIFALYFMSFQSVYKAPITRECKKKSWEAYNSEDH